LRAGRSTFFVAGDDDGANDKVASWRGGGLNPIDVGPLRRARELERLGFLHMAIQDGLGTGYGSAVKLIYTGLPHKEGPLWTFVLPALQ
jgi:predicted dinucleotide-binding enzyme